VLVTTNYSTAQSITYDLSAFPAASGPVTRWDTNTGGGDMYVQHNDVTLNGKTFSASFAANTVQTFEIQGVYTATEAPPPPTNLTAAVQ
jgi:galactan endo-1,6-beta-galactosidase